MRRDRIDGFGAASLVGMAFLLAVNQVVVHLMNDGFQPVFLAGLRSALAALVMAATMALWPGRSPRLERAMLGPGLLIGLVFSVEFVCLFVALDLTSVTRVSILFYSMPVWLALLAHMLLPGERIGGRRAAGLLAAFAGVALALATRDGASGEGSLPGDLLALAAAIAWAGIALCARGTRLRTAPADTQLLWQVAVSAPVLLALAPLFGPLVREPEPWHLAGGAFQVALASWGFMAWLWLLSVYPAAGVASFSFLSPVFGVALGWLLLGETVGPGLLAAAALVVGGLVLVNRPAGGSAAVTSRRRSP